MIEFAHPWLFLLTGLPLLMRLLPEYRQQRESVRAPFFDRLRELSGETPQEGAIVVKRNRTQKLLLAVGWLLLMVAIARPEHIGEPVERIKSARDLMIAVDISGSMAAEDFTTASGEAINRLQAVKTVLRELSEKRPHDRLGLIVFASAPYLQVPFSDDRQTWQALLEETELGMAGTNTVFGDTIGLAIKLFEESEVANRVLIVLTDGNDTGSMVPPVEAAKVASALGIKIYTIAIGDPESVDEEKLDLETIERVAALTGGGAFQALDREQLEQAYRAIAELEPSEYESTSYRPRTSLHHWPILLILLMFMIYQLLTVYRATKRRRQHVG